VKRAGEVCRLPSGYEEEADRFVLLLEDATEEGARVLILGGRVAGHEPGKAIRLKGLVSALEPL